MIATSDRNIHNKVLDNKSQLVTGPLSDKISRKGLIVWGMWICGYAIGALVMGGMAQLSQDLLLPFWFIGFSMSVSGLWVQWWLPSKNNPIQS